MNEDRIPTLLKQLQSSSLSSTDEQWLIEETLQDLKKEWKERPQQEMLRQMISTYNYIERSHYSSHPELTIRVGDVCFIDYGHAYQHEAGYQHFGLVLKIVNNKAFVVPMTSNDFAYSRAYDLEQNPSGRKHLMRFKQCCGLNRDSVLFLNDCKFINPSRIIEVRGRVDEHSELFRGIQKRVFECLFESL